MRCPECGADLPGTETCSDRFGAVLVSDCLGVEEAFRVHGLLVLTYYAQHPSQVKPWARAAHRDAMRQIFGDGRDWQEVLAEFRQNRTIDRRKAGLPAEDEPPTDIGPVAGERTIADTDPSIPPGHADRVMDWARSVAESRFLGGDDAPEAAGP